MVCPSLDHMLHGNVAFVLVEGNDNITALGNAVVKHHAEHKTDEEPISQALQEMCQRLAADPSVKAVLATRRGA